MLGFKQWNNTREVWMFIFDEEIQRQWFVFIDTLYPFLEQMLLGQSDLEAFSFNNEWPYPKHIQSSTLIITDVLTQWLK